MVIDYVLNLIKTLSILFIVAILMIVSFYTSYLAIPFLLLSVAGIGIYNYLKFKS